jgi:hypothetical protein
MQTYSADFFMMAFFTRKARCGVPIACGGVSPAGGAVPTTAMVTAAAADRADLTSSSPVLVGEAEGLQLDTVSMQQYRCLATQQGSKPIPGRLDYLRFPLAHHPTTLWDQRQSFGQLHGWSRGVVPPRLPFGFLLRQGLPSSVDSPLCSAWATRALFASAAALGRRWSAEGCRVAAGSCGTILCAPAEGFQLAVAEQNLFSI